MFPEDELEPGPAGAEKLAVGLEPVSTSCVATRREEAIARTILSLTAQRGLNGSICPSEAARVVAAAERLPDWSQLMGNVRRVALRLQAAGKVQILRKGRPVPQNEVRGVIRLRQAAECCGPEAATSNVPGKEAAS